MLKNRVRTSWRQFNRVSRFFLSCAVLLLLFAGGLMLALRYLVLPDIERYHDSITSIASQIAGQPVTIGKIKADWQGLRPHLSLTDVRILDKRGKTMLALQQVDTVVSWVTALTGQLRLHTLEITRPDLQVRRDRQGILYVAGMPVASTLPEQPVDYALADWLLHQKYISVREARIFWIDEQHTGLPLALSQVNMLIQNNGQRHRFSLRAQPPAELSAEMDLRGEFYGSSFASFKAWSGKMYAALGYVDVTAWKSWLTLPVEIRQGRGALRGWLDIEKGKFNQLTTDLLLSDVQVQLADGLPYLDLRRLRGRVALRDMGRGLEITTRKLSLQMPDGQVMPSTDFNLHFVDAEAGRPASGAISVNRLDMGSFSRLAHFLPLTSGMKQRLIDFEPRGLVSEVQGKWQGDFENLLNYGIQARFDKLSIQRSGKVPGFSRLSGRVDGNEKQGVLSLYTHNARVDAPLVLPEPLVFGSLIGNVSWKKLDHGMEFRFNKFSVENADLAGNFSGSYQTLPQGPGLMDLTVQLTHAAIRHAARYTPLIALDGEARDWLHHALIDGKSGDFNLRLKGDLRDFPFDEKRNGLFEIGAHASDVVIEYANGWPRVERADAQLKIQGRRLEVLAPTAMTAGGQLQNVSVVLPDMLGSSLLLQVRGSSSGETRHALNFIRQSPVRGYIDGLTDNISVAGTGELNLQLEIPLNEDAPAVVSGRYHFLDNDVNLGKNRVSVHKMNGDLLFSEASVQTKDLTGQILGGPATIALHSSDGGSVRAKVTGRSNVDTLRELDPHLHPWLNFLHGGFDWSAEATVENKKTSLALTSSLTGLVSDLPAPFAKRANEAIPLRLDMNRLSGQQDLLSVQYGKIFSARFLRAEEGESQVIRRGTIKFGNTGKWMNKDGIWLTGKIPEISIEGWRRVVAGAGESGFNISGADLLIGRTSGYGYAVEDMSINARSVNGAIVALLAARDLNGEVNWHPYGRGKFAVRLKNLNLKPDRVSPGEKDPALVNSNISNEVSNKTAGINLPTFDWMVGSITMGGKKLGRLELFGQQRDKEWVLERLAISNPDGVLDAHGKWQVTPTGEQTQVSLKLDISDAGEMLGRFGYSSAVKNGNGKLEGDFSWDGSPMDFSYATLNGNLALDTENGQFLQINPGVGKLLSILSLQALPKRISLDFTDVFSKGFKFDTISGMAQIKKGILSSNDFKIFGSSAKVTMKGQVDLVRETQDLRVQILPTVGNTASLLSAFAAGPAVGVGVYIANKLLREPLDKLMSFEYSVTGSWVTPNVEKLGGTNPAAPPRE